MIAVIALVSAAWGLSCPCSVACFVMSAPAVIGRDPQIPVRADEVPVGKHRVRSIGLFDAPELPAAGDALVDTVAPWLDVHAEPVFETGAQRLFHGIRGRLVDEVHPLAGIVRDVEQL